MRISVGSRADRQLVDVGLSGEGTEEAVRLASHFDLWLDHEDGSPVLRLSFEVRDGVPQCRHVELTSTDDGREVISSDLRNVKVEDLLEIAVQQATMMVWKMTGSSGPNPVSGATMTGYIGAWPETDDERRRGVSATRRARREVRRQMTPELLADVARVYRENVDGTPTIAVAEFTGRAHRTAALYVQKAREAGLLGPASRGKKGER